MAAVYVPAWAEGFELCQPQRQDDYETLHVQIDGAPRRNSWSPVAVRLIHDDEGKLLATSDSPWLGSHALVFRKSAIERLGSLLQSNGELLPLACSEADLSIFNATRVIDALDEQASSITRFSSGRVMRVTRYIFKAAVVADVDIFKIPNLRVSPTFVSERVVHAWTSAGLRGVTFDRVWSDVRG